MKTEKKEKGIIDIIESDSPDWLKNVRLWRILRKRLPTFAEMKYILNNRTQFTSFIAKLQLRHHEGQSFKQEFELLMNSRSIRLLSLYIRYYYPILMGGVVKQETVLDDFTKIELCDIVKHSIPSHMEYLGKDPLDIFIVCVPFMGVLFMNNMFKIAVAPLFEGNEKIHRWLSNDSKLMDSYFNALNYSRKYP